MTGRGVAVYMWSFRPREGTVAEFEAAYGPDGDWVRLFRKAPGYLGTELLRDGGRYLTVDRWDSAEAYGAFRAAHAGEHERLDKACEGLTLEETCLGAFEVVGAAAITTA
jgi:heme-degrading monooxygenase HmoA